MKNHRRVTVLLLVSVGIAAGIMIFLPPWEEELFTDLHFERLQKGMTKDEVAAILGGPAGDYTRGKGGPYYYGWQGVRVDSISLPRPDEIRDDEWYGPHGAIHVRFDKNNRLVDKNLLGSYNPPPPTFWNRLRIWLNSWNSERIEVLA